MEECSRWKLNTQGVQIPTYITAIYFLLQKTGKTTFLSTTVLYIREDRLYSDRFPLRTL